MLLGVVVGALAVMATACSDTHVKDCGGGLYLHLTVDEATADKATLLLVRVDGPDLVEQAPFRFEEPDYDLSVDNTLIVDLQEPKPASVTVTAQLFDGDTPLAYGHIASHPVDPSVACTEVTVPLWVGDQDGGPMVDAGPPDADGREPDGGLSGGPACIADPEGDEDGDELANGEDTCPLVPSDNSANEDGDGLGDACDPSGDTIDRVVVFDGFDVDTPCDGTVKVGKWEVVDGTAVLSAAAPGAWLSGYHPPAQATVEVKWGANGSVQAPDGTCGGIVATSPELANGFSCLVAPSMEADDPSGTVAVYEKLDGAMVGEPTLTGDRFGDGTFAFSPDENDQSVALSCVIASAMPATVSTRAKPEGAEMVDPHFGFGCLQGGANLRYLVIVESCSRDNPCPTSEGLR